MVRREYKPSIELPLPLGPAGISGTISSVDHGKSRTEVQRCSSDSKAEKSSGTGRKPYTPLSSTTSTTTIKKAFTIRVSNRMFSTALLNVSRNHGEPNPVINIFTFKWRENFAFVYAIYKTLKMSRKCRHLCLRSRRTVMPDDRQEPQAPKTSVVEASYLFAPNLCAVSHVERRVSC